MDNEAGAKTRHVAMVVRRFQDTRSCAARFCTSWSGLRKTWESVSMVQVFHS